MTTPLWGVRGLTLRGSLADQNRSAFAGLARTFGAVGMVRVRIDRVGVIVIIVVMMPVVMALALTMTVRQPVGMRMGVLRLQPAQASAEGIAKAAIRHIRAGRIRPLPFDVMVMAFLHSADLALEAQNLGSVFAHDAQRWGRGGKGRVLAVGRTNFAGFAVSQCQNLITVSTDAAVGRRRGPGLFCDPFCKSFEHLAVIA